jgi:predicted PurR-regulated permease PerM
MGGKVMSEGPDGGPSGSAKDPAAEVKLKNAVHQERFWRLIWWCWGMSKKGMIWTAFFGLIYLLRGFFPLIFITFVFAFVATSLTRLLGKVQPRLGWKTRVTIVYAGVLLLGTGVGWLLIPNIRSGAAKVRERVQQLPANWETDIEPDLKKREWYQNLLRQINAGSNQSMDSLTLFKSDVAMERREDFESWLFESAPKAITGTVAIALGVASLLFLSTLFSFLIVLDLDALGREVKKLEHTKLHEFYKETGENIVKFGGVLGNVLEAQAIISLVNAILTALGLWLIFGLPFVAFLAIVVFLCGFIPVAGVFISSVPICLVGLTDPDGGLMTCIWLMVFITGIHFVEAYILNPRIMGAKLKVNPVLILVILVVGHHALGVWGLLLGLPLCFYFFKHVIKREPATIGFWARRA